MKRLFILIGLGLIIWGILGLNELQRQKSLIKEVKPGYGIPEKDRENLAKDNTIAIVFIVAGGLLFLWGLTPSAKKTTQTGALVTTTSAPTPAVQAGNTNPDSIVQLERLVKLKEQGALTEEEFQKEKSKILG